MTGAQALSFVRFLLAESNAEYWTDAKILECLNYSLYKWVAQICSGSSNFFMNKCDVSVAVGENNFLLPNGVLYSAASACTGEIYTLENKDTGRTLSHVMPNDIEWNKTGTPYSYSVVGNYIYLSMNLSQATDYVLTYYYIPSGIANTATEIDFPKMHHSLLCIDAAILAKERDKQDVSNLKEERMVMERALNNSIGRRVHGTRIKYPGAGGIYFDGE